MKIVVSYKWAANPQDATVAADGTVDWSRAKAGVSDYDLPAIELARRFADAQGAELIGVTAGGAEAGSPMARKAALSRGLDRLVVAADDALTRADALRTALVLAAVIRQLGDVDLVLAGDSSIDMGAQMVPAILAGALGWPALAQVTSLTGDTGELVVERNAGGGTQEVRLAGPVVLSIAPDALPPRVPGMKDILAAGKKPVDQLALSSLPVPDVAAPAVIGRAKPVLKARRGETFDGADAARAAASLVGALRAAQVL